jgi:hypothetical protein
MVFLELLGFENNSITGHHIKTKNTPKAGEHIKKKKSHEQSWVL